MLLKKSQGDGKEQEDQAAWVGEGEWKLAELFQNTVQHTDWWCICYLFYVRLTQAIVSYMVHPSLLI